MVTSETNTILFGFGVDPADVVETAVVFVVKESLVAVGAGLVAVGDDVGCAVFVAVGWLSAVFVNWAATVSAAWVKMAFASNVGSTGSAGLHAPNTVAKINIIKIHRLVFLILLFIDTSNLFITLLKN
jgi:hypothetical protein